MSSGIVLVSPKIDDEERRLVDDDHVDGWLGDNFPAYRSNLEITTPCPDVPIYVRNADGTTFRVPVSGNRSVWKTSDVMRIEGSPAVFIKTWECNALGENGHRRSYPFMPQYMKEGEVKTEDKRHIITYDELLSGPVYLKSFNKLIYIVDQSDEANFPVPTTDYEDKQGKYSRSGGLRSVVQAEFFTDNELYTEMWVSVNDVPVRATITYDTCDAPRLVVTYIPGGTETTVVHSIDIEQAQEFEGDVVKGVRYFVSESKNSLKAAVGRYRMSEKKKLRFGQEDLDKRVAEEVDAQIKKKDQAIAELEKKCAELDKNNAELRGIIDAKQRENTYRSQVRQNETKERVMEVQREKVSTDVAIQTSKAETEGWKTTTAIVGAVAGITATAYSVFRKVTTKPKEAVCSAVSAVGRSIARTVTSAARSVVGAIMSLF